MKAGLRKALTVSAGILGEAIEACRVDSNFGEFRHPDTGELMGVIAASVDPVIAQKIMDIILEAEPNLSRVAEIQLKEILN